MVGWLVRRRSYDRSDAVVTLRECKVLVHWYLGGRKAQYGNRQNIAWMVGMKPSQKISTSNGCGNKASSCPHATLLTLELVGILAQIQNGQGQFLAFGSNTLTLPGLS